MLLGNGDGTFTFKSSPVVGNGPNSIAVGDFNGDGIPDLAVSNAGDNTVTVLLGNGDGTFSTKSTLEVGSGEIVVADFNGDGLPDLALSCGVVLLGKGDGTFTPVSETFASGEIVVADFNGDGVSDLVVMGGDAPLTVTALLGNGDGTFTAKSSFTYPSYVGVTNFVVVGDFNGDGIPDLATGNSGGYYLTTGNPYCSSNTVGVLLGNGDGTFTANPLMCVGSVTPQSAAVADFNGAGVTDLAIFDQGSFLRDAAISVLHGNGDATFTIEIAPNPTIAPVCLVAGDFNGDGVPDLAAIDIDSHTSALSPVVKILLNQITQTATVSLSNIAVTGELTHQIVASYPGDANYQPSTSSTTPLLAAKLATTLSLTSNFNPSSPGAEIVLAATLNPYSLGDFSANGETVTFYNGGTPIGTATLGAGVAVLDFFSGLPVGTYTLTAAYPGDSNFTAATGNLVQKVAVPAATPVSSPGSGTYPSPLTVTMTDSTPGATIYYVVDYTGNERPVTTSSTRYTVPFTLTRGAIISAIAISPDNGPSAPVYTFYTVFTPVPVAAVPVLSPPSGTYTSAQMVSITSATPGATIYYTTDGSVPGRTSPVFDPMNPIPVNANEIIKAYAVATGYALSPLGWAQYKIIPPYAPTPTFSLAAGFYDSRVTVSVMDSLTGAKIYYTTDHTTPTTSSPLYNGTPITISSTERLQAIAVATNYSPSAVAQSDYYIATAKPLFSKPSGTYTGPQMVTITDATPGAVIHYTTDGTLPGRSSPTLSPGGSIIVTSSETIKALAVATGYTTSPEGVAAYVITP